MNHIDRMLVELDELTDKLDKLTTFIETSPIYKELDELDRALMSAQRHAMETYSIVLEERLRRINK